MQKEKASRLAHARAYVHMHTYTCRHAHTPSQDRNRMASRRKPQKWAYFRLSPLKTSNPSDMTPIVRLRPRQDPWRAR